MRESTQVLVAGGGPAGSTAATLLAQQGFDVALLERETFPRYHIGESLPVSTLRILDLLGVREKVDAHGFVRKYGSYFEWGAEQWSLPFSHLDGEDKYSWQVKRSEFDKILLDHARSVGVDVSEGTRVADVEFADGAPAAAHWSTGSSSGRIGFDYLIDASGRAGVLSRGKLQDRVFHDVFKNVALWSYWRDASPTGRGPQGSVAVCSVPGGWVWIIPLHDGTTSVGFVTGKDRLAKERERLGGPDEVYRDALRRCELASQVLHTANRVSPLQAETDYSYAAARFCGSRYFLAGDAACFLDPLLSTGVHLANFSGMLAAAAIGSILRGEVSEDDALSFYERVYRNSYTRFLTLVSVFYSAYRGKDAYFFEAQSLTREKRRDLGVGKAFLDIVSGIEDLSDADDETAFEFLRNRFTGMEGGSPVPLSHHNTYLDEPPTGPESAVFGMYLTRTPELGLRYSAKTSPVPYATPTTDA
ncbi:NAD(P)/FAD-dependent oxidoreductase [Streptomonospora sp. PA3]|uniref:NAD(P)/FAD-dependent oxidoreductase n=1 Tax=Streptomonospora sp. PA3 TaxID=2607326 RepID=UPI0012DCE80E|nr:NAD(P)/FAD-dependent oxidoreductase [Streptomonospora sp. PA3]MUL43197.1 NAD(P)/FAD-dependent oxidoreductase [Streptomonospora sp. PA3]